MPASRGTSCARHARPGARRAAGRRRDHAVSAPCAAPAMAAPGARVLLIGCGALGQFALQYLRLLPTAAADLRVAVRELDAGRLERAAELGADIGLLDGDPAMTLEALGGRRRTSSSTSSGPMRRSAHAAAVVAPAGCVHAGRRGGRLAALRLRRRPPVESWLTTVAWGSRDDLREVLASRGAGGCPGRSRRCRCVTRRAAHARLRAGEAAKRLVLVP